LDDLIPKGVRVSCWHQTETGIYYSIVRKGLYYRDLESGEITLVNQEAWFFSVSPDGKSLLYGRQEKPSSNLMLVEGFR